MFFAFFSSQFPRDLLPKIAHHLFHALAEISPAETFILNFKAKFNCVHQLQKKQNGGKGGLKSFLWERILFSDAFKCNHFQDALLPLSPVLAQGAWLWLAKNARD